MTPSIQARRATFQGSASARLLHPAEPVGTSGSALMLAGARLFEALATTSSGHAWSLGPARRLHAARRADWSILRTIVQATDLAGEAPDFE